MLGVRGGRGYSIDGEGMEQERLPRPMPLVQNFHSFLVGSKGGDSKIWLLK